MDAAVPADEQLTFFNFIVILISSDDVIEVNFCDATAHTSIILLLRGYGGSQVRLDSFKTNLVFDARRFGSIFLAVDL